jgi:hypothetical protein
MPVDEGGELTFGIRQIPHCPSGSGALKGRLMQVSVHRSLFAALKDYSYRKKYTVR